MSIQIHLDVYLFEAVQQSTVRDVSLQEGTVIHAIVGMILAAVLTFGGIT